MSQPVEKHSKARKPFRFVAGDPALEVINTITHWNDPAEAEDLISDEENLSNWVELAGLLDVAEPVTADDVRKVAAIREEVRRAFAAVADVGTPDEPSTAALLRAAAEKFDAPGKKPALHAELAWRSVSALVALPADRIRECPSCGWIFYDSSRGGRRKWCVMSVCGTPAKVAAFRRRQKKMKAE